MRGWLTWGAEVFGWPPDVMRRQRLGDLHVIADRHHQLDQLRALARER